MAEVEGRVEWRLIEGTGPVPAEGMLVGEAGGYNEHLAGRPFVGKAGSSLSTYLLAADLPRPDLFITNLFPFWTGEGNPDPTAAQIAEEEWRLLEDIERVQPRVIGAVGRIATQWFLGSDVTMDTVHGIPHWSKKTGDVLIVPIYHPAAGFYSPETAALCQDDFFRFAYYLKHPVVKGRVPRPKLSRVVEPPVIRDAAVDTEGLPHHPWGLSWSVDGKHGFVYTGSEPPRLEGKITFHNSMHDLKVLRALGVDTSRLDYDDTMVKAFVLQLEPQSLKALAYRHLGLRMHEFDETVRPHFDKVALRWLKKAAKCEYPKPKPQPVADFAKKKFRVYKPWDAGRRIKLILKSYEKRAQATESAEDVEESRLERSWAKLPEAFQDQAAERVGGPFPEFAIFCVPEKQAVAYSGTDAVATRLIDAKLDALIDERGLRGVYEMDRRCLPFVDRMQEVGLRVEVPLLRTLELDLEEIREKSAGVVRRVVGDRWFNPGSGDQVARWLYGAKGLEPLKFTDTGRGSTSDESLQMLRGYHGEDEDVVRFVTGVQDYREADKYLGTFVSTIFNNLQRDRQGNWRVHPNFRVTRVVSGRLSSHDPNVLALPTRTDLGKRIRDCFVAGEGYVIVSADLSQIELRTMAHLCRDQRMRQAFEQKEDLHSLTATIIFKIPIEQFDGKGRHKKQRYVAKTINFAVMYGISARALLEQLYKAGIFDYMLEDCEGFIAQWFQIYGSVGRYLSRVWEHAEKTGYVQDMWGRICYIPNLRLMDRKLREAAQRLAGNFPVQSGAHGLVKKAEAELYDYIEEQGLREDVRPWLQLHDELDLEVKEEIAEQVGKDVVWYMTKEKSRFSVPIEAEVGIGKSWGSAK